MNKVAILVPTKDRLDFVIRLINYYVSIKSNHPIFIGDASKESSKELVLKASQGKIDVFYFHWENLNDRKTLVKLSEQASKTNLTEYCAYHGDDDFFIPESLSKCADFLDNNLEYASAQGRALCFSLDRDGPYGRIEKFGVYWDKKEFKGVTALERLQEISSNYWVPIFSVTHINNFILDIGNGVDNVLDKNFGEYVNTFTIAMRGRSKFIDCLYLVRNTHSRIEHPSHLEWITNEDWHLSYIELINSTAEVLFRVDKLSKIESNFESKLLVDRRLSESLFPHKSIRHLFRKKTIEYLDKIKYLRVISGLYRRVKFLSIFSLYLLISFTNFTRSNYYRDITFVLNSCKKN